MLAVDDPTALLYVGLEALKIAREIGQRSGEAFALFAESDDHLKKSARKLSDAKEDLARARRRLEGAR